MTAPAGLDRLMTLVRGGVERVLPAVHPTAVREAWQERGVGHPADRDDVPHLEAALAWLLRAQDATGTGGFARGYGLVADPYWRRRGWQPAYPETTGYIIPTLYFAAATLDRPELARRARSAAEWELGVQLASGAIPGGVVGQPIAPAIFNTGQVLAGWLRAHLETGDPRFADAAERAAGFLVRALDWDGVWRRENSRFAHPGATLYNARTAWVLAEAGRILGDERFTAGARLALHAVLRRQLPNGWFPDCCLTDPERPLLHTIAYTIRGLLEGGVVLDDPALILAAGTAAAAVAEQAAPDGRIPGRLDAGWHGSVDWSCLTGVAQMAGIWLRLAAVTGQAHWADPAGRAIAFLKRTQNRTTDEPGLRGGIKGSFPLGGGYGAYQLLNWATKFFADALLRHAIATGRLTAPPGADRLV